MDHILEDYNVGNNFLITRLLVDYLNLMLELRE
jgi:hypothetical protein